MFMVYDANYHKKLYCWIVELFVNMVSKLSHNMESIKQSVAVVLLHNQAFKVG